MFKKLLQLIKTRDLIDNLKFWQYPDISNAPETYLDNNITKERSAYLVSLFTKFFPNREIRILEIGSNVGRNLFYLYNRGYHNLTGVEINKRAIELMSAHYPDCFKSSLILNQPIENCIKNFDDKQFDVVFTMAVLEHIHPKSSWIFYEIQRITKNIITIEDEKSLSWRHFPRRYDRIFKYLEQIYYEDCSYIQGFNKGFMTRIFTNNFSFSEI